MSEGATRLDKWLWYARFFKSRTRATDYCGGGGIRVNGSLVGKAHHLVRPGDVLTFRLGHDVRVVRVVGLGERRGPAKEAQTLYQDLAPPVAAAASDAPAGAALPVRLAGSGRPTKVDRRAIERLRDRG